MAPFVYKPPDKTRHPWQVLWLKEYARTGKVRRSCAAAGVHHSTYYEAVQSDEEFAAEVDEARWHYVEWLEAAYEIQGLGPKGNSRNLERRLESEWPGKYARAHKLTITDERVEAEKKRIVEHITALVRGRNGEAEQ